MKLRVIRCSLKPPSICYVQIGDLVAEQIMVKDWSWLIRLIMVESWSFLSLNFLRKHGYIAHMSVQHRSTTLSLQSRRSNSGKHYTFGKRAAQRGYQILLSRQWEELAQISCYVEKLNKIGQTSFSLMTNCNVICFLLSH